MCEKMQAAGDSCEVFTVEGAGHGMGGWEKVREYQKYKAKIIEWLKDKLG
jgi:fermentation-respiration switch protein FrsA (DUF1100 family)